MDFDRFATPAQFREKFAELSRLLKELREELLGDHNHVAFEIQNKNERLTLIESAIEGLQNNYIDNKEIKKIREIAEQIASDLKTAGIITGSVVATCFGIIKIVDFMISGLQ